MTAPNDCLRPTADAESPTAPTAVAVSATAVGMPLGHGPWPFAPVAAVPIPPPPPHTHHPSAGVHRIATSPAGPGALLQQLRQMAPSLTSQSMARALALVAECLARSAQGQGGLRSGPALNPEWAAAYECITDQKDCARAAELLADVCRRDGAVCVGGGGEGVLRLISAVRPNTCAPQPPKVVDTELFLVSGKSVDGTIVALHHHLLQFFFNPLPPVDGHRIHAEDPLAP